MYLFDLGTSTYKKTQKKHPKNKQIDREKTNKYSDNYKTGNTKNRIPTTKLSAHRSAKGHFRPRLIVLLFYTGFDLSEILSVKIIRSLRLMSRTNWVGLRDQFEVTLSHKTGLKAPHRQECALNSPPTS